MITPEEVCVDAGVAIKVVTEESDFELADALFEQWANHDVQIIAPLFFEVEVDSILSQKIVLRRELTAEQGEIVFQRVLRLDVKRIIVPGQRERAWEIARVFNFPTVYDATYLALAELRGCEFWTADKRLYDKVHRDLSYVRWLGTVGG